MRALALPGTRLERVVLSLALGRLVLAGASLLAAAAGGGAAWNGVGLLLAGGLAVFLLQQRRPGWRRPLRAPRAADVLALAAPLAAAALLLVAASFRQGLATHEGDLLFRGRDATNDPLVYAALAAQLEGRGLPLALPTSAGLPSFGQELFFAWLAGLHAVSGLDLVHAAFRLRPALDVLGATLAAFALARALGASRAGASAGAALLALGGDVSQHAYAVARFFEHPATQIEAWGVGASFSLAYNPIAPALHAAFAACTLLVRLGDGATRSRVAPAIAAGVLVASLFETKIFLWPSFAGALAGVAVFAAPRGLARPLRIAAGVALAAALPSLLSKLALLGAVEASAAVGVRACPGCLPRALLAWSFGGGPSRGIFDARLGELLDDPALIAAALGATALFLAIHLGARLAAIPALVAGAGRGPDPGVAAACRVLGLAAALGLGAACTIALAPHPMNAGQLAWPASFGLWPLLGTTLGSAFAARRILRIAVLALLALPTGLFWIVDQGFLAPPFQRIPLEQRILLEELALASDRADSVLEPSIRESPLQISPVTWLAGRSVWITQDGMAAYLHPGERARRLAVVDAVFRADDRAAALAATRASGARWLLATAASPLRWDPRGALQLMRANAAGALYFVPAGAPTD